MIRVCHIITGLYAHGAERMLLKLLSRLDAGPFQCSVISLMGKGAVGPDIEALGIPVLALDLPRGQPNLAGLLKLLRAVRNFRPNLLQGWMYHGNLAATLASWVTGRYTPVLWNIRQSLDDLDHEKHLTKWLIRLSALLSGTTARILYNSETSAEQHEYLGFRRSRRVIIPNGFDVEAFRPLRPGESDLRAELDLPEEALVIGMAARDHPMKDHVNLLRAVGLLAPRYPELHLLLAGLGMDNQNVRLHQAIAESNLESRVHLLGEQGEMVRFFQSLDIAVLSSAWGEGFPNVLGEAMACGIPCVATTVGDTTRIIGDTGRVAPPGDAAALSAAIEDLAHFSPESRRLLGIRARERIISQYSLTRIAENYAATYREIANMTGD